VKSTGGRGSRTTDDDHSPGRKRRPLVTNTILLRGHLIVQGVRFLWWVVQGRESRVTVSHPVHGTKTALLRDNADDTARALARAILDEA
jgi:hypothetical protein